MDPSLNPYTPGSGRMPFELAGRQQEIDYFDLIVAKSKLGRPDRGLVLSGLRGVGKTSLLNFLAEHARTHDWLVISIEAKLTEPGRASVRQRLGREINAALRRFSWKHKAGDAIDSLKSMVAGFSVAAAGVQVGVDFNAPAASGELDVDFEELVEQICAVMAKERSAFAVFVDEMQDLDPDLLAALITTQHLANQRGWPFFVIAAGLPNLPAVLATSRSYAERSFKYFQVGALNEPEAVDAYLLPATANGGRFDQDALDLLVEASSGYPYFIQEFGNAIWDLAADVPFTVADAEAAIDVGVALLDAGFFPARWDRATPAERRYLTAMANTAAESPLSATVAAELGSSTQAQSTVRQELIRKGLVYPPEHGRVAFTVPGMADFIRRQDPAG